MRLDPNENRCFGPPNLASDGRPVLSAIPGLGAAVANVTTAALSIELQSVPKPSIPHILKLNNNNKPATTIFQFHFCIKELIFFDF